MVLGNLKDLCSREFYNLITENIDGEYEFITTDFNQWTYQNEHLGSHLRSVETEMLKFTKNGGHRKSWFATKGSAGDFHYDAGDCLVIGWPAPTEYCLGGSNDFYYPIETTNPGDILYLSKNTLHRSNQSYSGPRACFRIALC